MLQFETEHDKQITRNIVTCTRKDHRVKGGARQEPTTLTSNEVWMTEAWQNGNTVRSAPAVSDLPVAEFFVKVVHA